MSPRPPTPGAAAAPVAALLLNALIWGLSWWPLRALQAAGLHALWSTALMFALPPLAIAAVRPAAAARLVQRPALWLLGLAAGTTNACFNWAMAEGDVVRVVLLLYLMPLWSLLLAWPLLGERPTGAAAARVALALAGAALVLFQGEGQGEWRWPLPRERADWLGLAGGASFALTNVLLRRLAGEPQAARAGAMFAGCTVVAALVAGALSAAGTLPWPAAEALRAPATLALLAALALAFVAANLALQFGAARLPANVTAVVMLSELLFATASALALGAGTLTTSIAGGGLLIVAASLLAARAAARSEETPA